MRLTTEIVPQQNPSEHTNTIEPFAMAGSGAASIAYSSQFTTT
jgi:hypothetical protein